MHQIKYECNPVCCVTLRRHVSSLTLTIQLKSLMEREALEGSQFSTTSPSKSQPDELFLFPAESSVLTMLPGVARVVHSKASCTVHWLESGKTRPNAKELPAAQILGIHTGAQARSGTKSGRGGSTTPAGCSGGTGASVTVLGEVRQSEHLILETSPESSVKSEEKRLLSVPVAPSSVQALAPREEGPGLGLSDEGDTCIHAEPSLGLSGVKSTERLCSSVENTSVEECKQEQNAVPSPDTNQTPPSKPLMTLSEDGVLQSSMSLTKERTVEHIREEGWSAREGENVTLAELYLMSGKPEKLQLEYEWQPVAAPSNHQENGQASAEAKLHRTHPVLRCLLKLVTTEVNPKPLVGINLYWYSHIVMDLHDGI